MENRASQTSLAEELTLAPIGPGPPIAIVLPTRRDNFFGARKLSPDFTSSVHQPSSSPLAILPLLVLCPPQASTKLARIDIPFSIVLVT